MYQTSIKINEMILSEFITKYQNQEKFMAFCQECPNYNTLWSCPPLLFDAEQFLREYSYITIIGVKVIYPDETIRFADTPEKISKVTKQSLREVKDKLSAAMLAWEAQIPNSVSLASGGCYFCERCSRQDDLPCRHPEKMRYSLDAFGFDLTAITAELLAIELKWPQGSLPEYYTLIHALLTKSSVQNRFIVNI